MNANKQDAGGLPPLSSFQSAVCRDWMTNEQADRLGEDIRNWLIAYGAQFRAASRDEAFVRALLDLIGNYWDLAYKEGAEGRQSDTQDSAAQWTWNEIERRIRALSRGVPEGMVLVSKDALLTEARRLRYRADETWGLGKGMTDAGDQMRATADALESIAAQRKDG